MVKTTLFVSLACGLIGFALGLSKRESPRCYNGVPVVVAAQDIPAGTRVTFEMISQRSIPEHLATQSLVKPDSATYIVNEVIDHDVVAGDTLRWSDFPNAVSRNLDANERAVRVELDENLIRGDRVDLWSNGLLIAENAEVMATSGTQRWVKVTSTEAELVVRKGSGFRTVLRPR